MTKRQPKQAKVAANNVDGKHSEAHTKKRGFHADRVSYVKYIFIRTVYLVADIIALAPVLLITILSRIFPRKIDIGLGPLPTINSRYHKMCLERFGYTCETFVYHTWYFTNDFDVNLNKYCPRAFGPYLSYLFAIFRYRCIYTYFNGGPLGFTTLLARIEPFLFQLAGIKTVVMPFGADVQVLSRTENKLMVHAYAKDYPGFRHTKNGTAAMIDVWTHGADHIISGCDWVDYMYFWDTLMLAHFAIDTDVYQPAKVAGPLDEPCRPLRLLHAPNHRNLKGTAHILRAIDELRSEGVEIELLIAEGVPNDEMSTLIKSVDVIADQLILGWYAMFALEGLVHGKPVICHVRSDFQDLYVGAGLLEPGELPLIDSTIHTIKETLQDLASMPRRELNDIGVRSRAFVEKHHSIEAIGAVFNQINQKIGLEPSRSGETNN